MIAILPRRVVCAGVSVAGLCALLWPLGLTTAAGPIWLPSAPATIHTLFNQQQPSVATYRNHAYILTTRSNPASGATLGVYFTTNESGAWTTTLLSPHGPAGLLQDYMTALAVDPASKRLYAAWVYPTTPGHEAVGLWTRSAAGAWSGPMEVATSSQFTGPPSLVAAGGKVFVAFATTRPGPCDDSKSLRSDVFVAAYDGSAWSTPLNLTSCLAGLPAGWGFWAPKLAFDNGHLYLVSANYTRLNWDLWYMDNAGGSWSKPLRLTHKRDDDKYHYGYAIAASKGTAYVAFTAATRPFHIGYHEIFLAAQRPGGQWSIDRVSADAQNCDQRNVALVARAGRLGLAYILDGVNCGGDGALYSVPHLLTGTPGHWTEAPLALAAASNCSGTALSSDGDIFRLVYGCHQGVAGNDNLYYKPEFLDVVGPTTQLSVPATPTAPSLTITWSAQDPTPGSGVAAYEVQVREDNGPWQMAVTSTRSTSLVFTDAVAGHDYTFQVRARDNVDNWGNWVSATTHVA